MNDCPLKNKTRLNLGFQCTHEELESLKLIQTKLKCAEQAISMLKAPEGSSREDISAFVQGALEYKSNAMFLHDSWWSDITEKYKFKTTHPNIAVFIDFSDGSFYVME